MSASIVPVGGGGVGVGLGGRVGLGGTVGLGCGVGVVVGDGRGVTVADGTGVGVVVGVGEVPNEVLDTKLTDLKPCPQLLNKTISAVIAMY